MHISWRTMCNVLTLTFASCRAYFYHFSRLVRREIKFEHQKFKRINEIIAHDRNRGEGRGKEGHSNLHSISSLLNSRGEPRWGELSWHSTGKRSNAGEERQLAARRSPRYLSFTGSLRDFPGIDPSHESTRSTLSPPHPSQLVFSETLPIEHRDIPPRNCLCNYGRVLLRGYAGTRQLVPRSNGGTFQLP